MLHASLANRERCNLLAAQFDMCCRQEWLNKEIAVQLFMPCLQLHKAARLSTGLVPKFS